jgi:hypothetical protein
VTETPEGSVPGPSDQSVQLDEDESEELEADEPPASGEWVDVDEVIANPTEEEQAEGQRLGEETDDR